MELGKYFLIILLIIPSLWGRSRLPELKTKQALNNLRFISRDGKFTYFQRRSGSLLLSTNYKVKEIMKGELGTQYTLTSSNSRKQIVIQKDQSFHSFYGYRKLQSIYAIPLGGEEAIYIGEGLDPKLHLNDEWLSYYNPHSKVLHFQKIQSSALFFKVRLTNTINPYFIPNRVMISENSIYITDLNKKGFPGIISFERNAKESLAVFKAASPSQKIELCLSEKSIFVGSFGINDSKRGSSIFQIPIEKPNFKAATPIYQSEQNDIGNIVCDILPNKIFFIKNLSTDTGKTIYEVNELDLAAKKSKTISDIQFATQIINMDGSLLLPYRGKYYVLLGENNMSTIDSLPSKDKDNAKK